MDPSYALTIVMYYILLAFIIGFIIVMLLTAIPNFLSNVPFVPTRKRVVNHIIKLSHLKKGEQVFDLGCGDGRFLVEAQKKTKTIATGYENAVLPFILAKLKKWWTSANIKIFLQNFFYADLSKADVIYCYLGPDVMPDLAKKIVKECKKGTRIYSHAFRFHDLQPKKIWAKDKRKRLPAIYLYQL